jgi:multidrug efflux system membrane fusion protein
MRGVFRNPQGSLKSGLFVRVRLPVGTPDPTLLINDEALLSDQGKKHVYVVNAENKVEYRPVTAGQALHGLRAVKEGLSAGDRVIVTGVQRVRPGALVKPTDVEPAKAPHSPLKELLASNRKAVRSP